MDITPHTLLPFYLFRCMTRSRSDKRDDWLCEGQDFGSLRRVVCLELRELPLISYWMSHGLTNMGIGRL